MINGTSKNRSKKDRLQPQQHQMADVLRGLYGSRVDFALVEWDVAEFANGDRFQAAKANKS